VAALKSANARYVEASTPVAGAAEARAMVQASLDLPREVEVGGAIWVENGAVRVAEGGTKLRDLDEELVVLDEMARPYGWLVTFNSRRYAETQDFMDMLIGSGPVIVEAATRRLIHTGSNPSFVDLYEEYRWGTRS
jgi:hypothetical protein